MVSNNPTGHIVQGFLIVLSRALSVDFSWNNAIPDLVLVVIGTHSGFPKSGPIEYATSLRSRRDDGN